MSTNKTDIANENKISIVIPTYNQAEYLPICLDSVMFQEYPNIELIIVNDGSTDNTDEILIKFEESMSKDMVSYAHYYNENAGYVERCEHSRYPINGRKFEVIHLPENRGLSNALNTGFKVATGEYCTFIASDDMLLPSMLSDLVLVLNNNNADFAYADMHVVNDEGRILRRFSLPDYSFEDSFCNWYLLGICKLYRRALHDEVGYYDEKIRPQDHDMFLRFAMNGAKFVHLPKVLANVRDHDQERQVENHLPANWDELYKQSSELVLKARAFYKSRR